MIVFFNLYEIKLNRNQIKFWYKYKNELRNKRALTNHSILIFVKIIWYKHTKIRIVFINENTDVTECVTFYESSRKTHGNICSVIHFLTSNQAPPSFNLQYEDQNLISLICLLYYASMISK